MFEKAINQNLLRLMVGHKNSLAQGISKFNKINGVVSNLFKTNWVKPRRLKFFKECFFSCFCAAPSQLLEKHPWNSCWLQCVTWFMARNTEGETTAYQKEGKNAGGEWEREGHLNFGLLCHAPGWLPALLSLETWNWLLRGEIHLEWAAPHPRAS